MAFLTGNGLLKELLPAKTMAINKELSALKEGDCLESVSYFNMAESRAFIYSYSLDLLLSCFSAVLFVILLSLDVWNAFKRKAYWFPGRALVLSAPIIQLISFIDNLKLSPYSDNTDLKSLQQAYLLEDQLVSSSRRVMICVLIGYLLPGMVNCSFITMGSNLGALALIVIIHMASEVSFSYQLIKISLPYVYSYSYYWIWDFLSGYGLWFIVSWVFLLTVIILLVFVLSCAVLAGKSICNIISRKVPLALSCCCNAAERHELQLQCHSIRDHVLKCWIVVRASQPDYVMARSVFSSFVGLVVTVCLVFLLVDWKKAPLPTGDVPELITHVIQFLFIITGWFIISIRWWISVMYFPRGLRYLLQWEDFWTSNVVELKADLNARGRERVFREKRLPVQEDCIMISIIVIRIFSFLFTMAICLQKLMVLLSKACWCLSEIVFRIIRPLIFSREKNALLAGCSNSPTDKNPFFKYKEALEKIRMPGETPYSLWIANESAVKKVEQHMEKGFQKGKHSSQLIKLKEHRTLDPHNYEASVSVAEEEFFPQIGKSSWKMKAVSLIRYMIFYYEDAVSTSDIDDAIQAYCQAWSLMNIVDTSNPEANLVSQAADEEFDALEDIWKKHMNSIGNPKYNHSKEQLKELVQGKMKKGQLCPLCEEENLKLFSKEEEAKALKDENYKDSFHGKKEWLKSAAAKCSVYKTRKALDLDRDHSMGNLKSLLANVIFDCIDVEVDKAIIKNCNKWAQEGNEIDIYEAAYVAGIAEGVKTGIGELQVKVEESVEERSQILAGMDEAVQTEIGELQVKVEESVEERSQISAEIAEAVQTGIGDLPVRVEESVEERSQIFRNGDEIIEIQEH